MLRGWVLRFSLGLARRFCVPESGIKPRSALASIAFRTAAIALSHLLLGVSWRLCPGLK